MREKKYIYILGDAVPPRVRPGGKVRRVPRPRPGQRGGVGDQVLEHAWRRKLAGEPGLLPAIEEAVRPLRLREAHEHDLRAGAGG